MSADLFAEFEGSLRNTQTPSVTSQPKPAQQVVKGQDPFSLLDISDSQEPLRTKTWSPTQQPFQPEARINNGITQFPAQLQQQVTRNNEEDDGWGDFESAQDSSQANALSLAPVLPAASQQSQTQVGEPRRTRPVRTPTIELATNSLIDFSGTSGFPSKADPPDRFPKKSQDSNVLFDADDFTEGGITTDDDEFGEFEKGSPVKTSASFFDTEDFAPSGHIHQSFSSHLSSLSIKDPTANYPQAPKSPAFQERNPFPGLALHTPTESRSHRKKEEETPVTAWPSVNNPEYPGSEGFGDDWDAFKVLSNDKGSDKGKVVGKSKGDQKRELSDHGLTDAAEEKRQAAKTRSGSADDPAWDAVITTHEALPTSMSQKTPPSNVPPPSVLLSIFPGLLSQAVSSLFNSIGSQSLEAKNRILADPKVIEFLKGYLALATVAARVIAGRKLRWHRDQFLAKSMSISAAGSKGMKLAGVDKMQAARDSREAGDVADLWEKNMGRLRSLVATANTNVKETRNQLRVPEIRENMQIQTAKSVGTAPKPCLICGLKRDERITRVDLAVEDSFGEWWKDHWGHTTCQRFWLQHEEALRQR